MVAHAGLTGFIDNITATTTTTGTGTYTLSGAKEWSRPYTDLVDGDTYSYLAHFDDLATSGFELGTGVYTSSGATLTRATIHHSSAGGSAVSWAAGTKRIAIVDTVDMLSGYTNRDYLFATSPNSFSQEIPDETWTKVQWSVETSNTTNSSMNATDDATFEMDQTKDMGLWAASASVAWKNDGGSPTLTTHRRKLRLSQTFYAAPTTWDLPGAQSETLFHPDMGDLTTRTVQQVYLQPGFDPQYTAHGIYAEVWHNAGQSLYIEQEGIVSPLLMLAKLSEW